MTTFFSSYKQPTLAMSTPTPRKVVCGAVAVRPAEETRAELERACRQDREVLATPIPPQGRRSSDEGPAALTAERRAAIAGIAAAIGEETEATIAPLLRIAATATSAALRSAAPEEAEDHYDLRRWRRWSIKWDG